MLKDQHKQIVLIKLREQTTPTTLSELLKILGPDFSERTIRRWLKEWVDKGIIQRTGKKRGTHYLAINKNTPEELTNVYFSSASQKVIEQIKLPYELRKPVTYQSLWLDKYQPDVDSYLSPTQLQQLNEAGNRANNHKAAGTYARQIYNRLLIDLSYNSSRLEGNTYSLLETKKLLMEGAETPGKLDEEKTMILNHKEAIRFLVDQSKKTDINETTICTLHFLLSDGLVAAQYAGKVRDHGVHIASSAYITLENPQSLQIYLNAICSKANQITNPHEKSIFLLAHIAYLQAFVDVNKRTARLSANLPLIRANLVPLSFDGIKQNDYIDAMIAIYELNNVKPLVDLYMHSYLRTAELYDTTVEAIGFNPIRVQYRQERREIIRNIITKKLYGDEIEKYIQSKVSTFAAVDDQSQVVRDIHEDLEQLGPHNIIGLGITMKEVEDWRRGR